MAGELSGRRVAILAAEGVERGELEQPRQAVRDAGADVELLSMHDSPDDLPASWTKAVEEFAEGRHPARAGATAGRAS
jgi:putative intracellular protease/amidase